MMIVTPLWHFPTTQVDKLAVLVVCPELFVVGRDSTL